MWVRLGQDYLKMVVNGEVIGQIVDGEAIGQIYLKLLFLRVTLWAKLISH